MKQKAPSSSEYIKSEGKAYALYTVQQRAVPAAADGLKPGGRRTLWVGRNGSKYKVSNLAGATLPLHPHDAPEDSINTLTGPYVNNVPLFTGYGAFGTLLKPTAYGAGRYTSVTISKFAEAALFVDLDIVPMVPNYDESLEEPKHFLPLVPLALLNGASGIAVGHSTDILPHDLKDIIECQLEFLNGKPMKERAPYSKPTDDRSVKVKDRKGVIRWRFSGSFERLNTTEIRITKLPYDYPHADFVALLNDFLEMPEPKPGEKVSAKNARWDWIQDYEDNSKNKIDIVIKFKRGLLNTLSDEAIRSLLKLDNDITANNIKLVALDGKRIKGYNNMCEIVKEFTEWRLGWYLDRYLLLLDRCTVDIQKYDDIILSIKKDVAGKSKKATGRDDLKKYIESIGVVYVDYIADLGVYRFTEEELRKVEQKRLEALAEKERLQGIVDSDEKRKAIYISELKDLQKKFG